LIEIKAGIVAAPRKLGTAQSTAAMDGNDFAPTEPARPGSVLLNVPAPRPCMMAYDRCLGVLPNMHSGGPRPTLYRKSGYVPGFAAFRFQNS
jgi:hypothetical protein